MDKTAAILDTLNTGLFSALQSGTRPPADAAQAASDAVQRILDRP